MEKKKHYVTCDGTEPEVTDSPGCRLSAIIIAKPGVVQVSPDDEDNAGKREKKVGAEEKRRESRDSRGLWRKTGNEIGCSPGCSQEQDAENAVTLEGKILTVVNKFLTTSPFVNKVKLLMVSSAEQNLEIN